LKIEAEKGFRRTLFEPELVGPNLEINFVNGEEAESVGVVPLKSIASLILQNRLFHLKFNRKGKSLNDALRVFKESEETHTTVLTVFSYNCRVFCSPSMELQIYKD
jgi:hypothetical protein